MKPARWIGSTEFQRNLGSTLHTVSHEHQPIGVTSHGRPLVVVIPFETYEMMRRSALMYVASVDPLDVAARKRDMENPLHVPAATGQPPAQPVPTPTQDQPTVDRKGAGGDGVGGVDDAPADAAAHGQSRAGARNTDARGRAVQVGPGVGGGGAE